MWATNVGVYVIKKRKCGMETCMKTAQAKTLHIYVLCVSHRLYASSVLLMIPTGLHDRAPQSSASPTGVAGGVHTPGAPSPPPVARRTVNSYASPMGEANAALSRGARGSDRVLLSCANFTVGERDASMTDVTSRRRDPSFVVSTGAVDGAPQMGARRWREMATTTAKPTAGERDAVKRDAIRLPRTQHRGCV